MTLSPLEPDSSGSFFVEQRFQPVQTVAIPAHFELRKPPARAGWKHCSTSLEPDSSGSFCRTALPVSGGVKTDENRQFEIPEKSWNGFCFTTGF